MVSFEFLDLDGYASPPLRERYAVVAVSAAEIGGPGPTGNTCEYCFDQHPALAVRSQSGWRFLVGGILNGKARVVLVDEQGRHTVWQSPGNFVGLSKGFDPEDSVTIYCSANKGSLFALTTGTFSTNDCGFSLAN